VGGVLSLHVCRLCGVSIKRTLVDLGRSPLSRSCVSARPLDGAKVFNPLPVRSCDFSVYGGSLRVYDRPQGYTGEPAGPVRTVLDEEMAAGPHHGGGGRSSDSCIGSILNCELP